MPYEPPPPQWVNGKDAIRQIRVDINQSAGAAIEQLRAAIVHRRAAARFTNMRRPPFGSSPISVPTDSVPPAKMWVNAEISPDGTVKFVGSDDPPRPFEVLRSHLLRYWSAERRGRKPKVNKQIITDKVFELMSYHGEFVAEDEQWNCQARLEEEIAKDLKTPLATSTIRRHVVPALKNGVPGNNFRPLSAFSADLAPRFP
jgi:hypothetical protein